jgi:CDGSH-type Zn-finger protein
MKIVVAKDGPYIVSGKVPLSIKIIAPNEEGFSWDWKDGKSFGTMEEYSLCRCGHSKNSPTATTATSKSNSTGQKLQAESRT